MESKKRVIPVFCNVKPSQLRVKDNGVCPQYEIERFSWALEEAKYTVGLTFDSSKAYAYIHKSYLICLIPSFNIYTSNREI